MRLYERTVLPVLCDRLMRDRHLSEIRRRIVGSARGLVLEIGVGSGLNLPLYRREIVDEVIGLEPSAALREKALSAGRASVVPLQLLDARAEAIPLDDRSVDTVLTTWTLCSVAPIDAALAEIRRVLKPDGRLLFAEHGLAPDAYVRMWQRGLTPMWKRIGGGCHLDRPISVMIERAGFQIEQMKTGYVPGPKPMRFMYEGSAHIDLSTEKHA
ncbi:MAG: class I SAM-dependent methyltransferase [Vulcanimicrobiaceae bacterium]